ncbi:MAG: efflux transporter outer membrane subunit [Gemmatimonadaceae bacterium]
MRLFFVLALAFVAHPQGLRAQAPVSDAPILSLSDALLLARRNNPDLQQTLANRNAAGATRRSAYGAFLPTATASFQSQYTQSGQTYYGGASLNVISDVEQSQYYLGLTYRLGLATFINPRAAAAGVAAADADVAGTLESLRAAVTQQYLNVLQSQAKADLQDTLVASARGQLELVNARTAVGLGTRLDVRRAEVDVGQAQVASLQAHQQIEIDKLRLFQRIGVSQPANVRLTTAFPVGALPYALDSLRVLAQRQNPQLDALRSRERAAGFNVRRTEAEYSPTLQLSTGWGGQTYQYRNGDYPVQVQRSQALGSRASCFAQDSLRVGAGLGSIASQCSLINFTAADAAMIRRQNAQYPFNFTRSPWSISALVSLPLFDGFAREQRVEQSQTERDNAHQAVRARELQLTADVTEAYLRVDLATRTVTLQEQTSAKAREELTLAEERYRVGQATFLDVTQSRASYERAENDRISAIYDFHKAYAALESAVGRPLR